MAIRVRLGLKRTRRRAGWKSGVGAGTITLAVDDRDRIDYLTWKDNFQGKVHRDQVTVGGIR